MSARRVLRAGLVVTAVSTTFLLLVHKDQLMQAERREWSASVGQIQKKIFPAKDTEDDRILDQMQYSPTSRKMKQILLFDEHSTWKKNGITSGKNLFIKKGCIVDSCMIMFNPDNLAKADLVVTRGFHGTPILKHDRQLHLSYQLESALNRKSIDESNWTATYRTDSTLVAPYGKWRYFDYAQDDMDQGRNFAEGRNGKVAWIVSNCHASNKRMEYAKELAKHIQVDIFGKCGQLKCSRSNNDDDCWKSLSQKYKFFLSFENSNCKDYITEKFWTPLKYKILPVVMGARKEDYTRVAPDNSYIHVDSFHSPKHLADYLHKLDDDDQYYNDHFRWVSTGEFIDTKFFCRLCSLLHHPHPQSFHSPVQKWWWDEETCVPVTWEQPGKTMWP